MFDYVRNNPKLVQIFLAIIMLPFALWGVDSFVRGRGEMVEFASVGSSKITQVDFQQAYVQQREILRNRLGPQFNPAMLDAPEMRLAILNEVINKRLFELYAKDAHMSISDVQLLAMISRLPELQVDGKFAPQNYEQFAASQGLTKAGLDEAIRKQILMRNATAVAFEGNMVSRSQGNQWLASSLEKRDVSEITLKPDAYLAKAQVSADEVKAYYDSNPDKFAVPEMVRFDFVILSQAGFAQKASVSDADIKAWYDSHQDRYKQPEERRARHILILAEQGAKPEAVKAAEEQAKDLLAKIKKNPADFAKLAKQYSQDTMSAKVGGDLGPVSRGVMVKPFEDAVYSLKENEVSDVVRTEYGFHIIQLTQLKGGGVKSLAQASAEIAAELKAEQAAKKYAEAAEGFGNLLEDQSESLTPAAEKYGLLVQQGPWLQKGRPMPGLNEQMTSALLSDDAINQKRNTAAIEVAPNTLMGARVVEHKAASTRAFDEVKVAIEKKLKRDAAVKMASQDAEEKLAKLQSDPKAAGNWAPSRTVTRWSAGMPPDAARAVFKLPADKLPAYTSAAQPDGSAVIYRVSKIEPYVPTEKDDAQAAELRQHYTQLAAVVDYSAWLAVLRERYEVEINNKALEKEQTK